MPYPWECMDCDEYNMYLVENNRFYCKKMRRYVLVDERSCNTYFVKRDKNKKDERPSSSCYITTAICNILGYEDDCLVLESLRKFRDRYMKKQEYCLPLLEDYDVVGPLISNELANDKNSLIQAKTMLNSFINQALIYIRIGEYEEAVNTYTNMTEYLMDCYNIDKDLLSYNQVKQRKREI